MRALRVGDSVKLKNYGAHSDYVMHEGQVARVTNTYDTTIGRTSTYIISLVWADGNISATWPENCVLVQQEGRNKV